MDQFEAGYLEDRRPSQDLLKPCSNRREISLRGRVTLGQVGGEGFDELAGERLGLGPLVEPLAPPSTFPLRKMTSTRPMLAFTTI